MSHFSFPRLGGIWTLATFVALGSPPVHAEEAVPSKLVIEGPDRDVHVGDGAELYVKLKDPKDQQAKAPKDLSFDIELRFASGARKTITGKVREGATFEKLRVPIDEVGLVRVRALQGELLEGGTLLRARVATSRPLATRPTTGPLEGSPTRIDLPAIPADTFRSTVAAPAMTVRISAMTLAATMPSADAVAAPPAAPMPVTLTSPAPVAPSAGAAQPLTLEIFRQPERKLHADGVDALTIFAMLQHGNAPADIAVHLRTSDGKLVPIPLVIPKDKDQAVATLTSKTIGKIGVDYFKSDPEVAVAGTRSFTAEFTPDIAKFRVKASPTGCSILGTLQLIVELLDSNSTPVATDVDRVFNFAIDSGQGQIEKTQITVKAGTSEERTVFHPTQPGNVTVSASTPNMLAPPAAFRVTVPWTMMVLWVAGGLLGGLVAFWTEDKAKLWRVAIGGVTGVVLYWLFLFVLNEKLPTWAVANAVSPLVIGVIGGFMGTKVISLAIDKLGVAR
jgi:hypothetical protein